MKHRKILSLLLSAAVLLSAFSAAILSPSAAVTNPYSEAAMALDKEYAYDGALGAIYSPEKTVFKVWAPLAAEVTLNRFATGSDSEEGAADLGTVMMEKLMDGSRWTGVWTCTVEGDIKNTYYTYTLTNPTHICYPEDTETPTEASELPTEEADDPASTGSDADVEESRYVTRHTQDPYSYAVGVNGDRSMVVDLDSTDPDGWDNDRHIYVDEQTDAIIWEVQVKDFSWNENSGVSEQNRGKFLAFTETGTTLNGKGELATCVDYLKQLGVTHVQINPFYDFATVDESGSPSQFNWGYDPKNYGVPEGSYSTNPYDGNVRINECKQMIRALHNAGIGVIMDVVYNHTYSVDSCFNYTVPEYYYRMTAAGTYSQQSGCGNDTASERAMYRRYMREMLLYWTNEYHIDGYRFDLMGVHDGETMNLIREDMDAIDPRIILYGEGWAGNTVYDPQTCAGTDTFMCTQSNASKGISERIGFFNDNIRDSIKGGVFDGLSSQGFVNGNKASAPKLSASYLANTAGGGNWKAKSPQQSVAYASCHDNLTLYDKLVGSTHGSVDFRRRYNDAIHLNKMTAAIVGSAQGIDFILAGEEMGRSKDGDENSYKSPASLNMIDWSLIETNADLVSYYKGMFELRKAFSPFTAGTSDSADDSYSVTRMVSVSTSVQTLAYTFHNTAEGEWDTVAVIFNGSQSPVSYTLKKDKDETLTDDMQWVIVANDSSAGVSKLGEVSGLTFEVPAASAVIAVEKNTYEAAAIRSAYSRVLINSIYEPTGELLASGTLLGKSGEGYSASPDTGIPIRYELSSVDGPVKGVFADEDITVTYRYDKFVPDSFTAPKGDVDSDGYITIVDGTAVQRHLAKIAELDSEHLTRGDYDYSGKTNILDVTKLQRYLAGMEVAVCTVKTRYMGTKDGKTSAISPVTTQSVRLGDTYTTTPATVTYYKLDGTPADATGTVTGDMTVTYNYTYSVDEVTIHIKHDGALKWAPCLWIWVNDGSSDIPIYEKWPGLQLANPDDDGWYTTTFAIPSGYPYSLIVNKGGSPQTADYRDIPYEEYPEIWVVIRDDRVGLDDGKWIDYYAADPYAES
jgi:type I pullulanase